VCTLLALLSLYNPFLTISSACDVLHVHHPLSFRATLASSEWHSCTLDPGKPLLPALEALERTEPAPVVSQTAAFFPARQDYDVEIPLPQVTLGGVWFRPPPSL
jgi:hypothetical protein